MTRCHMAVMLMGGFLAMASQAVALRAQLGAGSKVWLEGSSTLHPFESVANDIDFSFSEEPKSPAATFQAALESQQSATMSVRIPVTRMKSPHKGLDANLQKSLSADRFPDIIYTMSKYRLSANASSETVEVSGNLSVAGVTKPETLTASLSWKDGRAVIDGEHALLMTDFGIKPPTMMMGAIKTDNRVMIKYHLVLEEAAVANKGANL